MQAETVASSIGFIIVAALRSQASSSLRGKARKKQALSSSQPIAEGWLTAFGIRAFGQGDRFG